MTTTLCPAVWGGKNRITKNETEKWFHLFITENDSNHGPTNDVCVILTQTQLESLRDSIVLAFSEAAPAPSEPDLAEK